MAVWRMPGRIVFTRMWWGASSFAAAFVKPMIAALAAL